MQKKFHYKNTEIVYKTDGNGMPVVLLHGFGEDAKIWNEQVSFLRDYCLLLIPDLPGSGLSTFDIKCADSDSIEYYADIIDALLKYENINSCIMLGHSMGGYITLAFAEKYPAKLDGFGLLHSTAFADNEEKKQNRLKGIAMMGAYGAYAFLKNTIPNLFAAKFKTTHPEKVETLIENGRSFSTNILQQYYKAMMTRPDRTQVLKESSIPVLFILGTDDVAAPMKDVLEQTHLPKISFIHILQDTGHMGMLENTEKMNKAILEFIKGIEYL